MEKSGRANSDTHKLAFLSKTKTELFRLLSKHIIMNIETSKIVVAAFEDKVPTLNNSDVETLSPCNHEEADTRIFLHALDMRRHSSIQHVMIKTVDTDVLVLAVALFPELNLNELWMDFGSSQNQSYFLVYAICNSLRAEKSKGLLFFHAFPGCDQTSFFENCRKKSTWSTWCNFDEVTETFIKLSSSLTIKAVTTDVRLDAQLS